MKCFPFGTWRNAARHGVSIVGSSTLLLGIFSCGKTGNPLPPPSLDRDGSQIHPVVSLPLSSDEEVGGHLYLGDTNTPVQGFDVWRWDHSGKSIEAVKTDASGRFSFPLVEFKEGQDYSFHVVDNRSKYLGPVDLSKSVEGVQAVASYAGGVGFDLGEIVVPLTDLGTIAWSKLTLNGKIGGGFRLNQKVVANISEFPLDSEIQSLFAASILLLKDTGAIYQDYLQKNSNSQRYAEALLRDRQFSLLGIQSKPDQKAGFRLASHQFLVGARLLETPGDDRSSQTLWSQSDFNLKNQGKGFHRADFLPAQVIDAKDVFLVSFANETGKIVYLPVRPRLFLAMPPLIVSVSTDKTLETLVEGAGYLSPVCLAGGKVIILAKSPDDEKGKAIGIDQLDVVEVKIENFTVDGEPKVASAKDYDAPFREDRSEKTGIGLNRIWKAADQKYRYSLQQKFRTKAGEDVLEIPQQAFLKKVANQNVEYYRVIVNYRGGLYQDSTAFLAKSCID